MTDALTIFGKQSEKSGGGWTVRFGMFDLLVYDEADGTFGAHVEVVGTSGTLSSRWFDDRGKARDWLESESRRIMRECFEIAGPLEAEDDDALHGWTPVRFRDV